MSTTFTPSQMASAILEIPNVSITPLSVTENGTYTASEGTAYSPVTVNVIPIWQSRNLPPDDNTGTDGDRTIWLCYDDSGAAHVKLYEKKDGAWGM